MSGTLRLALGVVCLFDAHRRSGRRIDVPPVGGVRVRVKQLYDRLLTSWSTLLYARVVATT